jgi:hypothetical protein
MNDLEKFEESLRALKPRCPDPETAGRIEAHLRRERSTVQRRLAPRAWAAAALAAGVAIAAGIWCVTRTPPPQPAPRTRPVVIAVPLDHLAPTLETYRMALARSPEALDALLLEQAKTTLTPTHANGILSPI